MHLPLISVQCSATSKRIADVGIDQSDGFIFSMHAITDISCQAALSGNNKEYYIQCIDALKNPTPCHDFINNVCDKAATLNEKKPTSM